MKKMQYRLVYITLILHEPYAGQAGHGRGQLLGKTIAARALGHLHELFIYGQNCPDWDVAKVVWDVCKWSERVKVCLAEMLQIGLECSCLICCNGSECPCLICCNGSGVLLPDMLQWVWSVLAWYVAMGRSALAWYVAMGGSVLAWYVAMGLECSCLICCNAWRGSQFHWCLCQSSWTGD